MLNLLFISKTKIKFYKKMVFSPPTSFGSVADNLWTLLYIHVVEPTLYKSFRHVFFYCLSMAYKEILSQDVKTFSCIKEGNVNFPLLIDPRKGRAFCKVCHIFFLFLLGKNRHKMYLRHNLCIKDIFNFEYFLLSVCLWWRGWDQICQTTRCSM